MSEDNSSTTNQDTSSLSENQDAHVSREKAPSPQESETPATLEETLSLDEEEEVSVLDEETPSPEESDAPAKDEETPPENDAKTEETDSPGDSHTSIDGQGIAWVSAARLAANRANARFSTGPRTSAGKLRSSQNAFKDGSYCRPIGSYTQSLRERMLELGEDPAEFANVEQGLRNSFVPANAAQQTLVHEIAMLQWQRRRLELGQAALAARRLQKLETEREREGLKVSQKISERIPVNQLRIGMIWEEKDSPTKFQKLLEWLDLLQGLVGLKDYAAARDVASLIYGKIPTLQGSEITGLLESLAKAGRRAPLDDSRISKLRLELLRETNNIAAQYELYMREHTELTPTMREECLAPTRKQRELMSQMSMIDRQVDQKIRLLLMLQKTADRTAEAAERTTRAGQRIKKTEVPS